MWVEAFQAIGAATAGFLLGWAARGLVDEIYKVTNGRQPSNQGT